MRVETFAADFTSEEDLLLATLAATLCSLASAVNDDEEFTDDKRGKIRTAVRVVLDREFAEFKEIPNGSHYNRYEWVMRLLKAGLNAYDMAKDGHLEGMEITDDSDA